MIVIVKFLNEFPYGQFNPVQFLNIHGKELSPALVPVLDLFWGIECGQEDMIRLTDNGCEIMSSESFTQEDLMECLGDVFSFDFLQFKEAPEGATHRSSRGEEGFKYYKMKMMNDIEHWFVYDTYEDDWFFLSHSMPPWIQPIEEHEKHLHWN